MSSSSTNLRKSRQVWPLWKQVTIAILGFLFLANLFAFYLLIRSTLPEVLPSRPNVPASPTQDWRQSPNYVSEEQFGKDWPFTVSEGVVSCVSGGGIVLNTSMGTYGLTGYTNTLGYVNIKDSGLWKNSEDGWGKVSLSKFTSYAVNLCP